MPAGGDDGTWERLFVDNYTSTTNSIEIAADPNDHMHLAWGTYSSVLGVHYAVFDATTTSWIITDELIVGQNGDVDLAVYDDGGTIIPHVAYVASYTLYAATRDPLSGIWDIDTVYDDHNVNYTPSISVDSGGFIHISFFEDTNDNLMYATNATPDTMWVTEYVDVEGNVGQYSSIVIDQGDVPYIVYYDATNRDLKYAKLITE